MRSLSTRISPAFLILGIVAAVAPGRADASFLIGTSVSGTLNLYSNTTTNWFDHNNGFVPAGYGNTTGTSFIVSSTLNASTFAYNDGTNFFKAGFADQSLTVSDAYGTGGIAPFTMTFVDSAFNGAVVSTSLNPMGLSYTLVGSTLSITFAGTNSGSAGSTFSSTFNIQPTPVPEPSSLALGLVAAAGLGFGRFRALRRAKAA